MFVVEHEMRVNGPSMNGFSTLLLSNSVGVGGRPDAKGGSFDQRWAARGIISKVTKDEQEYQMSQLLQIRASPSRSYYPKPTGAQSYERERDLRTPLYSPNQNPYISTQLPPSTTRQNYQERSTTSIRNLYRNPRSDINPPEVSDFVGASSGNRGLVDHTTQTARPKVDESFSTINVLNYPRKRDEDQGKSPASEWRTQKYREMRPKGSVRRKTRSPSSSSNNSLYANVQSQYLIMPKRYLPAPKKPPLYAASQRHYWEKSKTERSMTHLENEMHQKVKVESFNLVKE